ncbi:LAFE_0G00364g1_1 [Lachancea fermentati]|uniref:LAFE_0G00364g1_1 n=1 Tax=Lachancea fermentati TaxID=4955 RepID=A0A1G4MGE6_LACFM|nr:LAFE_0G00364g1_1 [Lachancea fermentati]
MDLLDQLDDLQTRKTAYKKQIEIFDEGHDVLNVTGQGFLFGASVLSKVKSRLEGFHTENTKSYKSKGSISFDTQPIACSYDGEELETGFVEHSKADYPNSNKNIRARRSSNPVEIKLSPSETGSGKTKSTVYGPPSKAYYNSIETQKITENTQVSSTQKISQSQFEHESTLTSQDLVQTLVDCNYNHNEDVQLLPHVVENEKTQETAQEKIASKESPTSQPENESKNVLDASKKKILHSVQLKSFSKDAFLKKFDEFSDESDESDGFEEKDISGCSHTIQDMPNAKALNYTERTSTVCSATLFDQSDKCKSNKPLGLYKFRLRDAMSMSPTIALDSDSDTDSGDNMPTMGSKVAVLELRTRLSRRQRNAKATSKTNNVQNTSLKGLFQALKKANKNQILEKRQDLFKQKGLNLEEIEKEKESVVNLLEQEIARNKRIRLKEKQKEALNTFQAEDETFCDASIGSEDLLSDYLSNGSASDSPSSEEENEEQDSNQIDVRNMTPEFKKENEEKDEEDDLILVRGRRAPRILMDLQSDDDTDSERKNIINLGTYGDNISSATQDKEAEAKIPDLSQKWPVDELRDSLALNGKGAPLLANNYNTSHSQVELPKNERLTDSDNMEEELHAKRIKKILRRNAIKELRARKKKQEMRKSGIHNMVEVEAQESEDEWFGVGGADGEVTDEYDSEIEGMIDDYTRFNFNPDEIRQRLMEEDKAYDQNMVNRILHDIKNGGFRKRGKSALDLELSDGEDDELKKYHVKRRELLKRKALETDDAGTLAANPRAQSFFESMIEDFVDLQELSGLKKKEDGDESPSRNNDEIHEREFDDRKTVISQEFVQRTLSFLNSKEEMEVQYESVLSAEAQSARNTSAEEEDFATLKQRSYIKNLHIPEASSESVESTVDDDIFAGSFQTTYGKIFGRRNDENEKFKEGMKTVKALNSYKNARSSKSSITYLRRSRKLIPKRSSKHKIPRRISNLRNSSIIFANEEKSFEN